MKKSLKRPERIITKTIGNWFKGGGFIISGSTSWHYNGSNYYLGYEKYTETYPSRMWIVKQTGNNIEYNYVNNGTSYPDNLDHTTPLMFGQKNGYIYIGQCDGWVKPIRVYKSTSPEDITAWTYIGDFDTDASYIWTVDGNDLNDMWFVTRSGNAASNGYDMSLLNVDLDDPTSYVKLQISEGNFTTNQIRHYTQAAYFNGTSTYRTLFINHRLESTAVNYKNSILLHKIGTDEIYDFTLSTYKDVGSSGALTTAELEADYKFQGTDSDKTVFNIIRASMQKDDDVYIINQTSTGVDMYKMQIGSMTPVATQALVWLGTYYLYDRGDKFILHGYDSTYNSGGAIWTIEYDLTGLTRFKNIKETARVESQGMPYNFSDIVGKYLVVGSAPTGEEGTVPMILTSTYI